MRTATLFNAPRSSLCCILVVVVVSSLVAFANRSRLALGGFVRIVRLFVAVVRRASPSSVRCFVGSSLACARVRVCSCYVAQFAYNWPPSCVRVLIVGPSAPHSSLQTTAGVAVFVCLCVCCAFVRAQVSVCSTGIHIKHIYPHTRANTLAQIQVRPTCCRCRAYSHTRFASQSKNRRRGCV